MLGLGLGLPLVAVSGVYGRGGGVPAHVILAIGQSNMAGRGTYSAGLDIDSARVSQFDSYPVSGTYQQLVDAEYPLLRTEGVNAAQISPAQSFAAAYALACGVDVVLVPVCQGGTRLTSAGTQWNPPSGSLYTSAISQANLALAAATATGRAATFAGCIWIQGESDGDASASGASYRTAFDTLVAGIRAGVTGASASWFVVGEMVPEAISTRGGTYADIHAVHQETPSRLLRTSVAAGVSGSTADNLHYNAAGCRTMGARLSAAVAVAKANSVVPGQVTGLTSTAQTSTTVSLSWTAPSSSSAVEDYVIEYRLSPSGSWQTFSDGASRATTATVTGLTESTAYDFRVTASNSIGTGTPSATLTQATSAGVVIYTFESDTVGAAPAGITKQSSWASAPIVRNTGGPTGFSGKYLGATSYTPSQTNCLSFDLFASVANQRVTWKRGAVAGQSPRDGFVLRAQGARHNAGIGTEYSGVSDGYHFQVSDTTSILRILRVSSSGFVLVGSTFSRSPPDVEWYRATANGTSLLFEYSTDGVNWNTAVSTTDSTYTGAGGVDYLSGFSADPTLVYIDDIQQEIL